MSDAPRDDFFERARAWAATGMFVAAGLLFVGSFLDWVMVQQLPETIPPDQMHRARPFNGFDVGDGYWIAAAALVLAASAVMVVLRARFSWLAFAASVVAGAIAIADYRGVEAVFDEFGGIGTGIEPGLGLTLVAVGALLGLVSSVAGVAASPRR